MCISFFGLRPKDYDFTNRVSLIEGRGGLQFEKYSMAHTEQVGDNMARQLSGQKGFTLFLNFNPQPDFDDGFGLILVMHSGNDSEQLIIGQWKSHIIAMNGDDYAHKQRLPRISFDTKIEDRQIGFRNTSGIDKWQGWNPGLCQRKIGRRKIEHDVEDAGRGGGSINFGKLTLWECFVAG